MHFIPYSNPIKTYFCPRLYPRYNNLTVIVFILSHSIFSNNNYQNSFDPRLDSTNSNGQQNYYNFGNNINFGPHYNPSLDPENINDILEKEYENNKNKKKLMLGNFTNQDPVFSISQPNISFSTSKDEKELENWISPPKNRDHSLSPTNINYSLKNDHSPETPRKKFTSERSNNQCPVPNTDLLTTSNSVKERKDDQIISLPPSQIENEDNDKITLEGEKHKIKELFKKQLLKISSSNRSNVPDAQNSSVKENSDNDNKISSFTRELKKNLLTCGYLQTKYNLSTGDKTDCTKNRDKFIKNSGIYYERIKKYLLSSFPEIADYSNKKPINQLFEIYETCLEYVIKISKDIFVPFNVLLDNISILKASELMIDEIATVNHFEGLKELKTKYLLRGKINELSSIKVFFKNKFFWKDISKKSLNQIKDCIPKTTGNQELKNELDDILEDYNHRERVHEGGKKDNLVKMIDIVENNLKELYRKKLIDCLDSKEDMMEIIAEHLFRKMESYKIIESYYSLIEKKN